MKQKFKYGRFSYDYYLEFSDRKTLGMVVRPDLRIIVKVPIGAGLDEIEAFMKRKWKWLDKHLQELGRYYKKQYEREYVSGETFRYLGRQYLLQVERSDIDFVKIGRNKLMVHTTRELENNNHTKELVEGWFERRRQIVFKKEFLKALKLFDYERMPQLRARVMTRRWGSYTNDKKISLNPKLIEAPTEAIYYVAIHELCHVTNKKHDELFYKELEKRMPNWRRVKEHLEVNFG